MHSFPPPPYDVAEALQIIYSHAALALLVIGVTAWALLFVQRRGETHDALIWGLPGFVLTFIFSMPTLDKPELWPYRDAIVAVHWLAIFVGCGISWLRLRKQKESHLIAVSMVIIFLLGIVNLAFSFPFVSGRGLAERAQCEDNLRNIGMGLFDYDDEHDTLPLQADGNPSMSWRVTLLPYLGEQSLFNKYDRTAAWDSLNNLQVAGDAVPVYVCPAIPEERRHLKGLYFTSYALAVGPDAIWTADGPLSFDEVIAGDGTSHTVMLVEACGQQIVWTRSFDLVIADTQVGINFPGNVDGQSAGLMSAYHRGGPHALMADGSVIALPPETDPAIVNALLTPEGGEAPAGF